MSATVRRSGRATLAKGVEIVWTVADGRRGRRWRAAILRGGVLAEALLLEVGVNGRPGRLELATAAGLLTLHPEGSGSLHGNAVTAGGVRHLTFDWSDEHGLEIEGIPIPSAVTARGLTPTMAAGEGRTVPVAIVSPDLTVRAGERRYERLDRSWRIVGDGHTELLALDPDGLIVWSEPAGEWPLELDERD